MSELSDIPIEMLKQSLEDLEASKKEKEYFTSLPNFKPELFEEITGIKV